MKTITITGDHQIEGDYTLDGNLDVNGSIRVTGFLRVLGWIVSGSHIKAGWEITAGGTITAGGDYGIYAGLNMPQSRHALEAIISAQTEPRNIRSGTFRPSVNYGWAWHVHHDTLAERLTEPIENRRTYIMQSKPAQEIETRLRLLKPMVGTFTTRQELEALHAVECAPADCPWNGQTMFPERS